MVINDLSAKAASKIRRAFNDLRSRMQSGKIQPILPEQVTRLIENLNLGNFTGLKDQLHFCTDPTSSNQTTMIQRAAKTAYVYSAQYNLAKADFPLDKTINATLGLNESMSILGAAMKIALPVLGVVTGAGECFDWEQNVDVPGSWNYIVCKYALGPRFQYSRAASIFGEDMPDSSITNVNDDMCQKAFGIKAMDGSDEYMHSLGFDDQSLANTTRLLASEGLTDPVTALGASYWYPGSSRDHSRVVYISQGAHASDMEGPLANEPQALTDARRYELNSMKEWLGMV
jgi:hypothetical protein